MTSTLLPVLDLGGTFVFAISGGLVAVRRRLDTFGLLVLAFATGNAGGITRDVLIGAVPPAAIANWAYLTASAAAATIVFFFYPQVRRLMQTVLWFDAVGLAFFAVAGAGKALDHGLGPVAAILLGTLTGVGGSMVRDVLTQQIPVVLRADFYASAALAGAALAVSGHLLGWPGGIAALAGGVLCFFLRAMAIRHDWHLPAAMLLRYRRRTTGRDRGRRNATDASASASPQQTPQQDTKKEARRDP